LSRVSPSRLAEKEGALQIWLEEDTEEDKKRREEEARKAKEQEEADDNARPSKSTDHAEPKVNWIRARTLNTRTDILGSGSFCLTSKAHASLGTDSALAVSDALTRAVTDSGLEDLISRLSAAGALSTCITVDGIPTESRVMTISWSACRCCLRSLMALRRPRCRIWSSADYWARPLLFGAWPHTDERSAQPFQISRPRLPSASLYDVDCRGPDWHRADLRQDGWAGLQHHRRPGGCPQICTPPSFISWGSITRSCLTASGPRLQADGRSPAMSYTNWSYIYLSTSLSVSPRILSEIRLLQALDPGIVF